MKLLVITDSLPYPMVSGDRVRTYNLYRRIASKHQLWVASLIEQPEDERGVVHMQEFCSGVETAHLQPRRPLQHVPQLMRYALSGRPPELKFQYSHELAGKIRSLVSTVDFDIIQIEHSHMALYLEEIPRNSRARTVLVFHNVASNQYRRLSQVGLSRTTKLRARLHSAWMRRWEPRYAERFDMCLTVSDEDRLALATANRRLESLAVIPNGVDIEAYQPLPPRLTPPQLLFLGTMSYPAGSDAALFFCRQVLPRIQERIPETKIMIVGSDPPPEVVALEGSAVHVTGRVEDVLPYYEACSVCVIPLRAGGGTRLKILEAMALGRPVVSTTVGCEGLDLEDNKHLLIADTPGQFADQTVRLMTDRGLYEQIATNARERVQLRYDWDQIATNLLRIYDDLVGSGPSPDRWPNSSRAA